MGIIKKPGEIMDEKRDHIEPDEIQTEAAPESRIESYDPSEMIVCAICARANPPNRLDCIYCGVKLEITEEQTLNLRPTLRKADQLKPALNLVYISKLREPDQVGLKEAGKMLRIDPDLLGSAVKIGCPIPLARSEQHDEMEIVVSRLGEIGFETAVFPDQLFEMRTATRRLRRVGLNGDNLEMRLFNNAENITVRPDQLKLIVAGAIFKRRVESTEKHSRKNENKILETAETTADELLIDLYVGEDKIGYRISANGFDFSCLNEDKGMVANTNVKLLVEWLRRFSPNASYDSNYMRLRGYLSKIWDVEEHTDSMGLKRRGLGAVKREIVTTSNNDSQFTKYSRLQRRLT